MSQTNGTSPQLQPTSFATATADDRSASTSTQETQSPDRLLVTCPSCKTTLSVRRIYIGEGVRCKRCSQKFLVPGKLSTEPIPIYDGLPTGESGQSNATEINAPSQRTGIAGGSLMDQLTSFVGSFNELRSAHDQLQADHDEVRAERDNICSTLEKATEELTSIRAALGPIAPEDVASLASERESLSNALHILRTKYETLLTDMSDREQSIARLDERVRELAPHAGERDALAKQVEVRSTGARCGSR